MRKLPDSVWLWMTFHVDKCSSFHPVTSCSIFLMTSTVHVSGPRPPLHYVKVSLSPFNLCRSLVLPSVVVLKCCCLLHTPARRSHQTRSITSLIFVSVYPSMMDCRSQTEKLLLIQAREKHHGSKVQLDRVSCQCDPAWNLQLWCHIEGDVRCICLEWH